MKRVLILIALIISAQICLAEDFDYMQAYRDMPVPDFSFLHNIDPGNYYDNKRYTWSPYPLFRLNSPLYFKNITIDPGYYLLTPRKHKDEYYILFKESGKVKYILPTYKRELVPEFFYDENLPRQKLSFGQKLQLNTANLIGKISKNARKKPIPSTFLEMTDLDNSFVSMIIYYDKYRYYTIFRTSRL